MERYTQEQLHGAFDLVKDEDNWKMPVDAIVTADADQRLISAAVSFFTGSLAEFTRLPDGSFRVIASGYYNCIGS